ncbi:MAG: leucine-rich repeat domain-containing protein, partial [Gammaproteobacteria bacterium]|nr:leucine-rich repeat domain-containing protein [Gammaproteobacteria bacterium]
LSNLTSLEVLELESNSISDVAPLVANTGLGSGDEVRVENNPLSATSINTHIPALQSRGVSVLYSRGSGGSGGGGSGGSTTNVAIPDASLRAVIADSLGKSSDAPITQAEMASLTHLAARNKNIRDLTGLELATNLTWLDLEGEGVDGVWVNSNEISNLLPLSNLTRLERLYLSGNSISDVAPLSNLTNLEVLWLDINSISDVTPLSNLTRLKGLELSGNSISSVTPLSNLTGLRSLTLSGNSISNMSALSGLTSLEWLDLSYNSISNVAPLSNLTSLIELDLAYNSISSVAPLSNWSYPASVEYLGLVFQACD